MAVEVAIDVAVAEKLNLVDEYNVIRETEPAKEELPSSNLQVASSPQLDVPPYASKSQASKGAS